MKLIPTHLLRHPDSHAEEEIYCLLQKVELSGVALHSVNISKHKWKPWTEIDFVLVRPFGILGLEVKGGVIRRHGGMWFTGENQLKESPYDQVRQAIFKLMEYVPEPKIMFGWGIVTPNSCAIPSSPETPSLMQATEADVSSPERFGNWIKKLEIYWQDKLKSRALITDSQITAVVAKLRPDFEAYIPLGRQAIHLNREIKRFTNEQLERLDEVEENNRIICTGGAGTGKTFLAIEVARREIAKGFKVLFVVRNQMLCARLQQDLLETGTTVIRYETITSLCSNEIWDILIVDEGQDLLSDKFLNIVDSKLKGGITKGRWRWFMDDLNQAGFYSDESKAASELLRDSGVTLQRLRVNCRNTEEIVLFTQFTTGADIGEAKVRGRGPKVETLFFDKDEIAVLRKQICQWHVHDGISHEKIVVLSCDPNQVSSFSKQLQSKVSVYAVQDFKGLESDFVAIVGISKNITEIDLIQRQLYTGLTRARVCLWIAIPTELKTIWKSNRSKYETEFIDRKINDK